MQSRIVEAKKQYANSPVESIPFPLWEPPPADMKQLNLLCKKREHYVKFAMSNFILFLKLN
jgi:hypothetical protein